MGRPTSAFSTAGGGKGYDAENGWAIGEEREYKDEETQDEADALSLYTILEEEIVPEFYDYPSVWTGRVRSAIASCGPQFSMRRMLAEYIRTLYVPAMDSSRSYSANFGESARQLSHWKQHVRNEWQTVFVAVSELPPTQAKTGDPIQIEAQVWPGRLSANDIAVELVTFAAPNGEEAVMPSAEQQQPVALQSVTMQAIMPAPQEPGHDPHDNSVRFRGIFVPEETGKYSFGVRARPHHPALIHPLELGLSAWA